MFFKNKFNQMIIRIDDTTDHGGKVLTGESRMSVMGKPAACIGDKVWCPKCNGEYEIVEADDSIQAFGRNVAFEGHKTSCGAHLISSLGSGTSGINLANGVLVADASGRAYLPNNRTTTDISDVVFHRSPIFRRSQPGDETLQVVINNNGVGHAGLVVGQGAKAYLYDPGGSYTGCFEKSCVGSTGDYIDPGSGEALSGSDVDLNDYLAYQRIDGPKVSVFVFVIDTAHADRIRSLIMEYGGRTPLTCAATVSALLRESGGIFTDMSYARTPWGLESSLKDIMYPGRGGIISPAY